MEQHRQRIDGDQRGRPQPGFALLTPDVAKREADQQQEGGDIDDLHGAREGRWILARR